MSSQATSHPVSAADLSALALRAERELKGNILPFWLAKVRNVDNGGFFGFIDADMAVRKGAARGGLLTCRILWTFSAAYRRYRDRSYLEMAAWAYRDLVDHFWDAEAGGFFWTIPEQGGASKDAGKLVYLQVFGIYALSEYYRATGDELALAKSIATYRLIEAHARDPAHGGYFDALDRNWSRLAATQHYALGRAPKSVNSHMHILEGYTNLLRVWDEPALRDSQRELLQVLRQRCINPCTHHSIPLMTEAWEPIGNAVSYGHDIELSWLISEAAGVLGDPMLTAEIERVSLAMANVTIAEAVDTDGGVISSSGPDPATDKEWWSQAEAAVGFFNAYQISGDSRLFEASRRSWDYIETRFVDRVHGDWIEKVRRDGTPIRRPKVTLWRCPYHSSRACLELTERVHQQLERIGPGSPMET